MCSVMDGATTPEIPAAGAIEGSRVPDSISGRSWWKTSREHVRDCLITTLAARFPPAEQGYFLSSIHISSHIAKCGSARHACNEGVRHRSNQGSMASRRVTVTNESHVAFHPSNNMIFSCLWEIAKRRDVAEEKCRARCTPGTSDLHDSLLRPVTRANGRLESAQAGF